MKIDFDWVGDVGDDGNVYGNRDCDADGKCTHNSDDDDDDGGDVDGDDGKE